MASPAFSDQTATSVYPVSLAGVLLAIFFAARTAGVRHARLRGRAVWVVVAASLVGLVLHSTSLGLVSFDLHWWVVLPALATAGVGFGATRLVERESLVRLRICGLLRPVDALSFIVVRDTLDLTPAQLSKHLKILIDSGYVTMEKTASQERVDFRRVAWCRLTPTGRNAFDGHIAALEAIARPPADVRPGPVGHPRARRASERRRPPRGAGAVLRGAA